MRYFKFNFIAAWIKFSLDEIKIRRSRERDREGFIGYFKRFWKVYMYQRGNFLTNFFTNSPIFKTTIKRICQLFVGRVTFLEGGPSKSGEKKKNCGPGFLTTWEGKKMWIFFFYIWISLMILSLHFYGTISWKKNCMKDNSKRTSTLKLNKNIFLFSFDQCFVQLLLHCAV